MASHSIGEMSDRARDVFRLVVEAYLDSGQPVGSRTISRTSLLNLSPASIRNVMQDLEERGLLTHPHTSAGRIPTEIVQVMVYALDYGLDPLDNGTDTRPPKELSTPRSVSVGRVTVCEKAARAINLSVRFTLRFAEGNALT